MATCLAGFNAQLLNYLFSLKFEIQLMSFKFWTFCPARILGIKCIVNRVIHKVTLSSPSFSPPISDFCHLWWQKIVKGPCDKVIIKLGIFFWRKSLDPPGVKWSDCHLSNKRNPKVAIFIINLPFCLSIAFSTFKTFSPPELLHLNHSCLQQVIDIQRHITSNI